MEKHLKVKDPEMNAKQTKIKQPWCITSSAKCRIRQRCYIWQLDQFAIVEFGTVDEFDFTLSFIVLHVWNRLP